METTSDGVRIQQINSKLANELVALDVVLAFYFIFGTIGNGLVTFIYGFRLKVRMDDKFFILVMSIMDTIVCLTGPVFSMVRNYFPVNFQVDAVCRIAYFSTRFMNGFSALLIFVIGVQRYFKVCHPMKKRMTGKLKKIVLCVTIAVTFLLHIPILLVFGVTEIHFPEYNVTGYRCGLLHGSNPLRDELGQIYLYFMFGSALFTMSLICLLYGVIGRSIYRHLLKMEALPGRRNSTGESSSTYTTRQQPTMAPSEPPRMYTADSIDSTPESSIQQSTVPTPKSERKKPLSVTFRKKVLSSAPSTASLRRNPFHYHRYSIMFLIISLICVVTYTPGLADNLVVNVDSEEFWTQFSPAQRNTHLFLFQFYLFNHVVNPIIYSCFDSKFRKKLKDIFCK